MSPDNKNMKIEIVKHFCPDDEEFYGDYNVTVEHHTNGAAKTPRDILVKYNQCNTDEAEAFARGYYTALFNLGMVTGGLELVFVNKADCEEDLG